MKPNIRDATKHDAANIAVTYNHYIAESIATFQTDPVTAADIVHGIDKSGSEGLPWMVADSEQDFLGYAYASAWSSRLAYRYSVETTVYVAPGKTGRGVGLALYSTLLDSLRSKGMHAAIARIALPNVASVALHEKMGFGKAGHFSEIGFKFDRWIDVGYWQLMLEKEGS